jgi:hypothetical protein
VKMGVRVKLRAQSLVTTKPTLKTANSQPHHPKKARTTNPDTSNDLDECECPISPEDYVTNDKIITLPCTHTFHGACLKRCHEASLSCPRCTRKLGWTLYFAEDEDDDVDMKRDEDVPGEVEAGE